MRKRRTSAKLDGMAGSSEPGSAAPAPASRRRRYVFLAAVALVLGLRAALPYAVAWGIESAGSDAAGIPIEVAGVDLGVLAGSVAVDGIRAGRAGQSAPVEAPWLRVGRLSANVSWLSLLRGRIRLSELAIDGPVVRLVRLADGSLEIPLPPPPPEPPPAEPARQEGGRPLALDVLRVAGLDFELADAARSGAAAVSFALDELGLENLAIGADGALTLGGVSFRGPRLSVERSFVLGPRGGTGGAAPAPAPAAAREPAAAPEPAPAAPSAETPPAPPAAGPRYRLERVSFEKAGISLRTETRPLDLEVDFSAEGVSAAAGETFPLRIAVRVEGGEATLEGRAGIAPPSFDGAVRWHDLPVPLFVLVATPELVPWVRSCRADGDLAVAVRLDPASAAPDAARARLSGSFAIRDLAVGDPDEKEVAVAWRALDVGVDEVLVPLAEPAAPIRVSLATLRLDAPSIRYGRPTPALDALLGVPPAPTAEEAPPGAEAEAGPPAAAPAEPPAAEAGTPAPAPIELAIGAVEIAHGTIQWDDGTLATPYRGAVRDLAVTARDVRWPALRAKNVRVRGVAPDRAPFTLAGSIDGTKGKVTFEIQRLPLPPLDPYAAGAGYKLARGEASLRTSLELDAARYVASNEILLHDLRLDSADAGRFEQQFGTSLDFALALLRDRSGDIRLPIPVSIDRSELRLGLRTVVLGALRAALVGVVSSPLKALGAAMPRGGSGDVDVAAFAAEPGSAEPAPSEAPRIATLVELLHSRPLLAIELAGRAGDADRPVLAERIAIERAVAGDKQAEVEGSGFLARRRIAGALRARAAGEPEELSPEDAALLEQVVAATPVPPERLAALADERAQRLHAILVDERGVEAARVAVAKAAPDGAPGVALELAGRVGEGVYDDAAEPGPPPAP
jgi:hypothetical protein